MLSRPIIGRFPVLPNARQDNMDRLPEELVIRILHFLSIKDLVHIQLVSSRYLSLARDDTIWKEECFTHSRSEARRRRQHQLDIQDARLAELRYALTALPGSAPRTTSTEPPAFEAKVQLNRALANWDPSYPDEKLDFYEEYISRHAPVQIGWLDLPKTHQDESREATGIGILHTSTHQRQAIAPLDDGSICIYDISARSTTQPGGSGKLIAQSQAGLLSGRPATESHTTMTETGAVECVSIDSTSKNGYFGVGTHLHQIDLNTLQISSTKQYPWPITALSECSAQTPVTVGTNHTIHLYDPRDPSFPPSLPSRSGGELIGGSIYSHAPLPQPGPLSILNSTGGAGEESIWIAGRFTSLLHYDRRFFPRLLGTTFIGARIASLAQIPRAFVPRNLDLLRNPTVSVSAFQDAKTRVGGSTIVAAAEYKGKGSLEMYGIPNPSGGSEESYCYRNRQTASASKLLSVAPHRGKLVFSDGDGNLRWFERDASSHIRSFNIQDSIATGDTGGGLWQSTGSELPGQGDIVQKILPLTSSSSSSGGDGEGRPDIGSENLLLWTGDGRLGILGFGHTSPLGEDRWEDGMSTVQRAREDAERQYGMAMRRALERNADEVRFVRGLGMGYE